VHKLPRRIRETETVEEARVRCFQQLLAIPELEYYVVESDEKQFPLEAPMNSQNERVNTTGRKRDIRPESLLRPVNNLNFVRKLLVFCAFSIRGKVCIHIFPESVHTLDGERYRQLLTDLVLPSCIKLYPDGDFIYQQDGASSHTAKET